MAKQDINIGVEGNDGTGDSIRESFRKTNENFTELYAIFGQGGAITFTTLDGTPTADELENNPSTASRPNLVGVNVGTQGSELQFFKLVSQGFVTGDSADDTIEFDLTNTDSEGNPVIVVNATKSSVASDTSPTLGGNLNLAGNFIAANPAPVDQWPDKIEQLQDRDGSITIDDILITKGYADSNYIKSSGSGTGSQLRVRTEDQVFTEDYTFVINDFSGGNLVINDRTVDGETVSGEGHGLDSAANGAEFVYQTTGTSAVDSNSGNELTDTSVFAESKFFIRVVTPTQLSLHPSLEDAEEGTNRIAVSGGSGTQTIVDYYFQPNNLSGKFLANEAVPRESVVRRQGDQMEGELFLNDHPGELAGAGTPNGLEDLQAASKFYVDNTSFSSSVNLYVALTGSDTQANTPPGKEGRAPSYAFRTLNAAARKAEEIIESSPLEPGPYLQTIEFGPSVDDLQPTFVEQADFDQNQIADYGANTIKFTTLIRENLDFVIEETIAWIDDQIESANSTVGLTEQDDLFTWLNFAYNEARYRADLRTIIESARLDATSGTQANKLSRQAGLRFFSSSEGRQIAVTQQEQILETINKAVEIFGFVFNNTTYPDVRQNDFAQYQDPGAVDAPDAAVNIFEARIDDVTNIIQNGFEAAPTLREGAPYIVKMANGGNSSVFQGQENNTDLIPGKVVVGQTSGAIGRIISYTRDINDGTNTDTLELILEEPIEFLVRGEDRDIQNTTVAPILGDGLEFGNRVSNQNITIFVESGIFYEDYPIKVPANVSVKGDEFRRTHIRPRNRVSQSKYANTYFYRDYYFDDLQLHNNEVEFQGETVLTLDGPVSVNPGDVITQATGAISYNESEYRNDLATVLENVGYDVALGTNYNSVAQGLAYQRSASTYTDSTQKSQFSAALGYAKNESLALTEIQTSTTATSRTTAAFDEIIDILNNGAVDTAASADTLVFPGPVGVGQEKINARNQLQSNRAFIANEIESHISNDYSAPAGYDNDKLVLDVGFYVDALTYDVLYGGDSASTNQALYYFVSGSFDLDAAQKDVTIEALSHLQSIIGDILQDTLITRATGNTALQNTDSDAATSAESSQAVALLGIISSAVSAENTSGLQSPTYPSVGWATQEVQDARSAISNSESTIIDDTITFIDNNTGTRAIVQEKAQNSTSIVVTYDDGYIPNGPNVAASTPFNTDDEIELNNASTGVTPTVIDNTNTKDFNMGWHYAANSRKPVSTNSQLAQSNPGGFVNAAEIMRENKQSIQQEVIDFIDNEASLDVATGFGLFAQVTLALSGEVPTISKGDTIRQATTGAQGLVKEEPVTVSGFTSIVIASPTAVFDTSNTLIQVDGSSETNLGGASVPASTNVEKFEFTTKCFRDIGYIVDAIVFDLINGGNDQALEVQGRYYEGAVEVGQEELTSQAISRVSTIASSLLNISAPVAPVNSNNSWKLDFPSAEAGSSLVVSNLVSTVVYAFDEEYNPPLHNGEMDVFLMNDATILRNLTVQGHGGFMCVLDPEGQILTKSPYIQTGSSFSQSINKQAFRGGMFVDGFVANMPIEIVGQVDGNPFRLYARSKRDQETVDGIGVGHGLFVRRPELPAPFYVNGIRYQVNAIVNHVPSEGTCELILDANSGTNDGNDNAQGWLGPVIDYTNVNGVRTPVFGNTDNFPTLLQTAGNRSMLGNDFTQINDLGYGLLVTNTGISEMVSMFTYYCHAAYYANNGSEIRSLNGSNAYGNFGLVASGSDPNEVAQTGSLKYNTIQTAKVYVNEALQASADQLQTFLYVYDTDFIPLPEGEVDIIFTERQEIGSFDNGNELTIIGHGFATGQKITVSNTTGVSGLNDDHFISVIDANSFTLFADADLTTPRSFTGSLGGNGVAFPADGEGTDLAKFELVNVQPALQSDGIPAVNQQILTLDTAVIANYGDTIIQQNSGAQGTIVNPQQTEDTNGAVVGGTELIVTQSDGSSPFTTNPADVIRIVDVNEETDSVEFGDSIAVTNVDSSGDTSGLPLEGGNGAVWRLSFSNNSNDNTIATGGLTLPLFGGESIIIRARAKFILDDVETVPIRPSTAVVFEESPKTYRSINFDTTAITDFFGDRSSNDLPDGQNILTFDTNYEYILQPVRYENYETQARLVLTGTVDNILADTVISQSSSGASAVVKNPISDPQELTLKDWNGTNFDTSGELSADGSSLGADSVPTEVYHFDSSQTFGATAGDTLIATSGVTSDINLARLQNSDMIFGWKDRVHTVIAVHDGEGNAIGNPAGGSLMTGFPYLEISASEVIDKNTESGAPSTGIARPIKVNNENENVTLSIGIPSGEGAEITVNISLTRATGHDFSQIGTGGFNTSNYPNVIFGEPAEAKTAVVTNEESPQKAQVWERGKGRVFFASTDEDGFFRIGKFFTVDQGTGTVTFAAQIAISGLDGLGFRDGETINKFSADTAMSQESNQIVPTESAVVGYVNRRLGFDKNMSQVQGVIGDGFLPQKNPVLTQTLDAGGNPNHELNMSNGFIVQLGDPVDDLDATNKQYVDKRIFANDSIEDLTDVELNDTDFANDYGANDLIVLTGNKRVFVKDQGAGSFSVGDIITGYATATAAEIVDLEAKTLDNGENVQIVTYKPLRQTSIVLDSGLSTTRGQSIRQANTGAIGIILWPQNSSDGQGDSKTDALEIILHSVTGSFSTDAADTLTLIAVDGSETATSNFVTSVNSPSVVDFENERIENTDGVNRQTTGGFDGADVTTQLEFANASEANDSGEHGAPGADTRSDVNIIVNRTADKTEVNLQYQQESLLNKDVNTFADIAQEKLDMNNAPVLPNSNAFEDASTSGQRTRQANQGVAAFDASTFAEDQIWTLSNPLVADPGDILTQASGSREAYVVENISSGLIKVRTADTFATGSSVANRLTRIIVNESDFTKDPQSESTVTIDSVLNTGYINIKDRGISFDKIQDLPEKTVIGRADIDFDGDDEGAGESGITRAIPFSLIVDEGGALQDKDFNNSNIQTVDGRIIQTAGEITLQDGDTVTQSGSTGQGTVQGDVFTENQLVLINTSGSFNFTGELEKNGVSLGAASVPSSISSLTNLTGSALTRIDESIYGSTPITKNGSGDSLVRTLADGDTISGIDTNLNLAGWINVRGLIVDSERVLDTDGGSLNIYTPRDHLSMSISGAAPTGSNPDTSRIVVPTASLTVGDVDVEKTPVGGDYNGFASNFQQNAEGNNPANSKPYIVSPWVYTNFIQSPSELGSNGTGVAVGGYSSFTSNDEIAMIVNGSTGLLTKYGEITFNTTGENRVTINDGTTTLTNNLSVTGASTLTGNVTLTNNLTVNGNTSLGNATGDTVTYTARIASSMVPNTDGSRDLGTGSLEWGTLYANEGIFSNGVSINASDAIAFEDGKHWITFNDGQGNFNLRVGHYANSSNDEESTEDGYAFHDEWSQSSGSRQFNISAASLTAGDLVTTASEWWTQVRYDADDVRLSYRGDTRLTTTNAGISVTGDIAATDGNFSGDLNVTGDLAIDGSISLGDNASVDTLTVDAIVTNNELTLFRDNNGTEGFSLLLQHKTDSAANNDQLGEIAFRGTNNTNSNDDAVRASIQAVATNVINSIERSAVDIFTAQGTESETRRLRISNDITAYEDFVSSGSVTIGQSGDTWTAAYIDRVFGVHRGDIEDSNGNVVVEVGTAISGSNATTFKGKFEGPLTGGVDKADEADTIRIVDSGNTNSNFFPVFAPDVNASEDYDRVYNHGTLYFNPSSDTLHSNNFNGDLNGNVTGNVTGTVSSISNHDTGDLSEGSNLYFTTARARNAFSAGTGISISNGQISISTSTVTANTSNNIKVDNTNSNQTFFPTFVNSTGSAERPFVDTANFQYNPSSNTLTATNFNGNASSANYADLAERYTADNAYTPGTVVVFGGEKEVTACSNKGDRRAAGVVSTNPAYLMNNSLQGSTVVDLALQGRVPCQVIGKVEKGDMLVTSAVPGYAIVDNEPKIGTVIGKAVEQKHTDGKGVIEVVVGRV